MVEFLFVVVLYCLVKYPYPLITPNKIAALINAFTILPIVYRAKIVAKLSPINAANPCKHSCAIPLVGLALSKIVTPKIATSGAKITIHFITPVKKNCSSSGLVPTK